MTALYAQPSTRFEAPTITSIAYSTHPEEHPIQISVARMMGIDYVFLSTGSSNPKDREIMRLAFQLCEELELTADSTMFMLAELNADALEDNFQQCQIRWVDGYPIELKRISVTSEAQLDYLHTILGHSTNYRSYLV
jgi:hypothetical protein